MLDVLDIHTHTTASGHAYNTIYEMAQSASRKGLALLGSKGTTGTQASFVELFEGDDAKIKAVEADIAAARQALERRPYEARAAAALTQARWMAEELRVSMFAQTLGTPNKVSMKRLLGVLAGAR